MAQGGTLFLDEIGDLPLPLQVKLLRVLETKEYQPLGARQPQKADVRFVAATHCDLEVMVEEGSFRRDLFFRLNVVNLRIPPLRERQEDIPLLIDMALDRFNRRYSKKIRGFSSEALKFLLSYAYPGNVRELLNIVEQSVILCRAGEIGIENLPTFVSAHDSSATAASSASTQPSKERLQEILDRNAWNKSKAARELAIDRTTLWRWMKRYNIEG
jgi:transcriptional regulator with PAS, ATPase and Fis domain